MANANGNRELRRGARDACATESRSPTCAPARAAIRCCCCTAGPRPSASGGATSSRSPRPGFEVIVPDLRGYGDSGLAPDGFYDPATHARDMHALVTEVLGHERCAAAGGDVGGVVIQDLGLRFPGFVVRQCLFNTVPPVLPELVRAGGHPAARSRARCAWPPTTSAARAATRTASPPSSTRRTSAAATSRSSTARGSGPRPGTFTEEDVDFMTEPFADADKLRASFGIYETALGTRPPAELPRLFETNPVPDAGAVRARGPRDPARLPRALRGRVHRARSARFVVPRAGPLHAVGAGGRAEPESGLLLRRPEEASE